MALDAKKALSWINQSINQNSMQLQGLTEFIYTNLSTQCVHDLLELHIYLS